VLSGQKACYLRQSSEYLLGDGDGDGVAERPKGAGQPFPAPSRGSRGSRVIGQAGWGVAARLWRKLSSKVKAESTCAARSAPVLAFPQLSAFFRWKWTIWRV
jgi:hypothetical protein